MKRFFTLILLVSVVICALYGCGCDNDIEADLVFVNQSDAAIVEVVVEFQDQSGGSRNADSSPLRRGDSFGFEAGEYPVTVVAYGDAELLRELGRVVVREAPAEGERWYITARDGVDGLALSVDTRWPEGV